VRRLSLTFPRSLRKSSPYWTMRTRRISYVPLIILERVYGRPLQASEVLLQDQRAEALAARQPMMPEQVKAGMAEVWG
jgi:hypothetical protein